MDFSSRGGVLVGGSPGTPEGLREPATERTGRVADGLPRTAEASIDSPVWAARQPRCEQREPEEQHTDGNDPDDHMVGFLR
jgi:hypothetical protein